MRLRRLMAALAAASGIVPAAATAYPGGTGDYQTDAAPYCASCHSSRGPEALAGMGERAEKEVAERKHIALILAGEKGYAQLGEADRQMLADQIRALDVASSVSVAAPDSVAAGSTFEVTVSVTGGAGPVVGVALVDAAHRWFARPAASAGWLVAAPPQVVGPDGNVQLDWLAKRPESLGRNLSFVNITGISSNSATQEWASARVTFTLRAPTQPGAYPLAAAYFYGTEKSSVLGYTENAMGWKEVRGGFGGGSGRVLFSTPKKITVE
jgi:mono/diheme cytochrome c family protein